MTQLNRDEYVTIAIAAERLKINQPRIRQWVHRKGIARRGKKVLFSQVEQIDALMRAIPSDPESEPAETCEELIAQHASAKLIHDAYTRFPGIDLEYHLTLISRYGFDIRDPAVIQKAIDYCLDAQPADWITPGSIQRPDSPCAVVYYARLGNRIKIGTSTNVRDRMTDLSAEELITLEYGGRNIELQRHREFATLRVVGEWFRMEEPLMGHMTLLAKGFKPEFGVTLAQFMNGHPSVTGLTCSET